MKRILIVCLLGMGLLLPSTTITAKNFTAKRIVDVALEGDWLGITSDASTGTLVTVKIWNAQKQLVLQEGLHGYEDGVDVGELANGTYSAQVFTTLTNYSENFTLN